MHATSGEQAPTSAPHAVSKGQVASAVVLVVGLLLTGYGFFHTHVVALYAGLLLTLVGVLTGLVQLLWQGKK